MMNEVNIPPAVTRIEAYTFQGCPFQNISLTNNIVSIGESAFRGNTEIKSILIPSSVKTIGSYAFDGCNNLGEITLSNGLETIGSYAFSNTKIVQIVVPDSVQEIGNGAFKGCDNLMELQLPFVGKNQSATAAPESNLGYIFGYTSGTESAKIEGATRSGVTYEQKQHKSTTGFISNEYYYWFYYVPQAVKKVTITKAQSIMNFAFDNYSWIENITINDSYNETKSLRA